MDAAQFFSTPIHLTHKRYEALRAFCFEQKTASVVAKQYGYTQSSLYSLVRDFKETIKTTNVVDQFFIQPQMGRKVRDDHDELCDLIIALRKKYLSVGDIKSILDAQNKSVSERTIYNVIHKEGFARLPRRSRETQFESLAQVSIPAAKACLLTTDVVEEEFSTQNAGLLCFLPFLKIYGIDKIIETSNYPGTQTLPTKNSILCFLALKLSNVRRYTADDLWCMDRGTGLFADLNILPKTAWFTSYSHRVTREMNLSFLKSLNALWMKHGLLSDTANMDFVAIPYWGEDSHLENNWSGTRHKALSSILAAIANDPDTGIITYGDANVRHLNEAKVAVEFLDFYKSSGATDLKYLVFDSKFTTYQNLAKLDENGVKFLTIRRRGKSIVSKLDELPTTSWKKIRVPTGDGKMRSLKVCEQLFKLDGYGKEIRQIAITGHGKIKPALIISNDFDLKLELIVRKYARRWLVEKAISEQTHFFHLNRVSSSMVIKVDFDLTMTILAQNLYRLFALELTGYERNTAQTLYDDFIHNAGRVKLDDKKIVVKLKKKRNLPAMLTRMKPFQNQEIPWLNNRKFVLEADTHS